MTRAAALAVIPARYGATRFPGKPLALLWGQPLVRHVWERARRIPGLDALAIATDDDRIAAAAAAFGARVERTSPACASGTDRVAEVARRLPQYDLVLNLQGDEPELDAGAVGAMLAGMRADPSIRMATLAHREEDRRVLALEHVVKVRVDGEGFAHYFTRRAAADGAPEAPAGGEPATGEAEGRARWAPESRAQEPGALLRHIGVYGFRRETLLSFAAWSPAASERAARLEQLRALEHGVRIRVFEAAGAWTGIDTPEQLAALERRGPDRGGGPRGSMEDAG